MSGRDADRRRPTPGETPEMKPVEKTEELERFLATMPKCIVQNISSRVGSGNDGNVFGRRRLGNCVTMIIDISGFTGLTEKYIQNKDKIQQIMNTVMVPLIELIKDSNFELIDIAGDALLLYRQVKKARDNSDARCIMAFVSRTEAFVKNSPTFRKEKLNMKYAAAISELHLDMYKGRRHGWIINGPAMKKLSAALTLANRGEFICDFEVKNILLPLRVGAESKGRGDCFLIKTDMIGNMQFTDLTEVNDDEIVSRDFEAASEILEKFVPDLVRCCKEPLPTISDAVIKPAVVCFLKIRSEDPKVPIGYEDMQTLFARLSDTLVEREGAMRQFMRDDKGVIFIAAFGSSKNIEKPAHNAILWARDVEKIGAECTIKIATGITMGNIYQGPLGSKKSRIDFTLLGFEVNLSARFMGWALKCQRTPPPILAEEALSQLTVMTAAVAEQAEEVGVSTISIGSTVVKGSTGEFPGYAIVSSSEEGKENSKETLLAVLKLLPPLRGRRSEHAAAVDAMREKGLCIIEGESGIGKTLIAHHATSTFLNLDSDVLLEDTPVAVTTSTSKARQSEKFLPIQLLLSSLKDSAEYLTTGDGDGELCCQRIEAIITSPEDKEHISLLRPLMPWLDQKDIPTNDDTESLSEEDATAATVRMLADLLVHIARKQPTVFILENLQWFDPASTAVVDGMIATKQDDHDNHAEFAIVGTHRTEVGTNQDKWTSDVCIQPLVHVKDSFEIIVDTLGISPGAFDDVYHKNPDFAELVHQCTNGVPRSIIVCISNMSKDGIVKATLHTLRITVPIRELPIFESLRERIIGKFLAMEKDEQIVVRTAALIGRNFDNEFLKSAVAPLTPERLECIFKQLVNYEFMEDEMIEGARIFRFQNIGIVDMIKTTMLEEQRVQLCVKLSNQLYVNNKANNAKKDATKVMVYHQMALTFAEGMGALGTTRLGTILYEYAYWALENDMPDLAMDNFLKLVDNIHNLVEVVKSKSGLTQTSIHPAPTPTSRVHAAGQLDHRLQLTDADIHEVYCLVVRTSTSMDLRRSLDYAQKACEIIGCPYVGPFCSGVNRFLSKARFKFGPLNWFRYPAVNVGDHGRVFGNHVALCAAVAYMNGVHFGNTFAHQWWTNEALNIRRVCENTTVTTASLGSYAVNIASSPSPETESFDAFSKFHSNRINFKGDSKPKALVASDEGDIEKMAGQSNNAHVQDFLMNEISVRLLIPQAFKFEIPGEVKEEWKTLTRFERIKNNNFYNLLGPVIVASAYGKMSIPEGLVKDCEAAIEMIDRKFQQEQMGFERTCICYALWFAVHMISSPPGTSNGDLGDYAKQLEAQYHKYAMFAKGPLWNTSVLAGTKMASILIHHVRICVANIAGASEDIEFVSGLFISQWSQIEQYTGALKQVPVLVFLAFQTANYLLMTLDRSVKTFFKMKLTRILDWATETIKSMKVLPKFVNLILDYFKACREVPRTIPDALAVVATKALELDFLLVYVNAQATIALLKNHTQIEEEVKSTVGTSGIAMYALSRLRNSRHAKKARRDVRMSNMNKAPGPAPNATEESKESNTGANDKMRGAAARDQGGPVPIPMSAVVNGMDRRTSGGQEFIDATPTPIMAS